MENFPGLLLATSIAQGFLSAIPNHAILEQVGTKMSKITLHLISPLDTNLKV